MSPKSSPSGLSNRSAVAPAAIKTFRVEIVPRLVSTPITWSCSVNTRTACVKVAMVAPKASAAAANPYNVAFGSQ